MGRIGQWKNTIAKFADTLLFQMNFLFSDYAISAMKKSGFWLQFPDKSGNLWIGKR